MLIKNMGLLISWLIINIKIDHPLITKIQLIESVKNMLWLPRI